MIPMKRQLIILLGILHFPFAMLEAQIPVEFFAGDKKVTADVMFFKFFKNKEAQPSNWLFFNRNRVSIDYAMTTTTNLPQFSSTEAFSYNHKSLKGFAPVVVAQLSSRGVYPKAGIQYAMIKKQVTVFTWVVGETLQDPYIDWFFLGRYTPEITKTVGLFSQVELINGFPTAKPDAINLIQRLRLGVVLSHLQVGVGTDFTSIGRERLTTTQNMGGFVRYEF